MDYDALINAAVASARQFRAQCEEIIRNGGDTTGEAYTSAYASSERALNEAESYRNLRDQSAREHAAELAAARAADDTPTSERNAAATVDHFNAYINRFRADAPFDAIERRDLTIRADVDGGYTVPGDRQSRILTQTPAASQFVSLITRVTVDSFPVMWLRVQPNETSGYEDIYTSAFVGTMVGETGGGGSASPEFGTFEIHGKRARLTSKFSKELASDSRIDLEPFLYNDGAINLALLRESQVLAGSGVGNNVRGVLNMGITTVDVEGSTSNTISNSISDQGSAPKLLNLVYAVPAQYRAQPSFSLVMNPQTELAIRKLVDAEGRFIWVPGFNGEPNTLFNKRVVHSEFMPTNASPADGTKVILAGPLAEIISPEKDGLSVQVLVERYADEDNVAIVMRHRFGAGVPNLRAFRLGVV